jgi:hypothetical protein
VVLVDEIVARNIERLCTVEMRPLGMPRGFIHKLNAIIENKYGSPSTLLAAKQIIERANKNDNIIISTGAGIVPWVAKGETDGPLGAAALGNVLNKGLALKPIFIAEELNFDPIEASCDVLGLKISDYEIFKKKERTAFIRSFPYGDVESQKAAQEILDEYQPSMIITLEKLSPNEKGIIHTVRGFDHTNSHAKVHHLINQAMDRNILTIGIGDGGNEIGFGVINKEVKDIVVPFGRKCQCPCQAGIAAVTKTDFLIVAAVSNWGAYGLEACLAGLLKDPDLLHSSASEQRMLEACAKVGGTDALYLKQMQRVDGIPSEVNQSIITILREIVLKGLEETSRIF